MRQVEDAGSILRPGLGLCLLADWMRDSVQNAVWLVLAEAASRHSSTHLAQLAHIPFSFQDCLMSRKFVLFHRTSYISGHSLSTHACSRTFLQNTSSSCMTAAGQRISRRSTALPIGHSHRYRPTPGGHHLSSIMNLLYIYRYTVPSQRPISPASSLHSRLAACPFELHQ